ncbi:hypothetical protein [Polaromonas sp.]|uniref:hypothetical protein n=1 Tax=Polaromonas sp. TaxID=1869339 RepID=UPI00352A224D
MTQSTNIDASGDGTRPSTDGGVDNIGAGEKFSTKRNAAGEEMSGGPAPTEGTQDKRKDVKNSEKDDSAPFGLTQDFQPETNREPS